MKRLALLAGLVVVAICAGAIQITYKNVVNQRRANAERDAVTADLQILYAYLGKLSSRSGKVPATWAHVGEALPMLNEPIVAYELHSDADGFEPLIIYRGEKARAAGWKVSANGVVMSRNTRVRAME